jgi:hypothetical protein
MYLTVSNLADYLVSSGLVTPESVVEGDFAIAEAGRRNRNFKVARRRDSGLFIKQIKTSEAQAISTVQREAAFYQAVQANPLYARLAELMPRLLRYEPGRYAIVLEYLQHAESLAERQVRTNAYDAESARLVGSALGLVHSFGPAIAVDPAFRTIFTRQLPWPLMLDTLGPQVFQPYGAAGMQLYSMLQQTPGLIPMLCALRMEWVYDSLIHGDMKWDNCLAWTGEKGEQRLRIVDWELADLGDGAWDVASILKEYLVVAIFAALTAQQTGAAAAHTMATLRPSIREFWAAYAAARGLIGDAARIARDRAVRFTAARLVTAVLEYLHASPNASAAASAMIQSSAGILLQPGAAAAELFGYPV